MRVMYSAIQCDGAALPNLTDSVPFTAHSGLFAYLSTVSYTCPAGHRFDDGNTDVLVTCTRLGLWHWNHVVTSCGREFLLLDLGRCVLALVTGRMCAVFKLLGGDFEILCHAGATSCNEIHPHLCKVGKRKP